MTPTTPAPVEIVKLEPIAVTTQEACALLGGICSKSLYRLVHKHGYRPCAGRWSVERLREIVRKESEE